MRERAIVALILALAPSGCMFKKKPAPPPAAPAVVATPSPPTPPPTLLQEIAPDVTPSTLPTLTPPISRQEPLPPRPKPPKRAPRRKSNAQPPPAATPAPTPQPAPPPQLGEIMTAAQQSEMNRAVDQSVGAARATLARIRARRLTGDQSETAARIRTFAGQADQARKTDLRLAVQLARRAEVLARDLEASVR